MMRIFLLLFLTFPVMGQTIRPFQTTRLISTSGAGVASVLVTEGAILNPASVAFFTDSHLSYQNNSVKLSSPNSQRITDNRPFSGKTSQGFFLFENSGTLKGGFSYQAQHENAFRRERGTATAAAALGKNLSFGILYRYTQDRMPFYINQRTQTFNQAVLGLTYVYSPDLVFGLIAEDPFLSHRQDTKSVLGVQYNISQIFMFIGDYGGDYTRNFSKNDLWRAALQVTVMNDFFIRVGQFNDKTLNLKGQSWGISWVGPKLALDFAMKYSRQDKSAVSYLYPDERVIDMSFALSSRF